MQKKWSQDEILKARDYLNSKNKEIEWFKFDKTMMTQINQFFGLKENKQGVAAVENSVLIATLVFGWIDYNTTGITPQYVNDMLNSCSNSVIANMLRNLYEYGCGNIDTAIMNFYQQVKGGHDGAYIRWKENGSLIGEFPSEI